MNGFGFFKRLLGQGDAGQELVQAAAGTRMLVVDDSPTIRAVLGNMLTQQGYTVEKAEDGESALAMIKANPPQMIFLDVVLPGINGFAVLRALRHEAATQATPIVMISGNQQATEQFYVQRFGADDFIKKPFGQQEVLQAIDLVVRAGRLPSRTAAESEPRPLVPTSDATSGMAA